MTEFPKVEVGDHLVLREKSYRGEPGYRIVRVSKVARKYFSVETLEDPDIWYLSKAQFYIDSGYQKTRDGDNYPMRVAPQEIFDEESRKSLLERTLQKAGVSFHYGARYYSAGQLAGVCAALGVEIKDA